MSYSPKALGFFFPPNNVRLGVYGRLMVNIRARPTSGSTSFGRLLVSGGGEDALAVFAYRRRLRRPFALARISPRKGTQVHTGAFCHQGMSQDIGRLEAPILTDANRRERIALDLAEAGK